MYCHVTLKGTIIVLKKKNDVKNVRVCIYVIYFDHVQLIDCIVCKTIM
jgi:hypothetical protein